MEHDGYKEALALDALDALDEAERCALYEHLLTCSVCHDEWRTMRDTAAALAYSVAPARPPEELRARIFEAVRYLAAAATPTGDGRERTARDATDGAAEAARQSPRAATTTTQRAASLAWPGAAARAQPMHKYGALAASLVAAALGIALALLWQQNRAMRDAVVRLTERSTETQTELAREREELAREREVRELLTAPAAHITELTGTSLAQRANARYAFDPTTGRALLVAYDLPPAPAGKAYQLWFIKGGKPMPGSVFQTDERGSVSLREQVPVEWRDASTFAVTLEREQGEAAPKGAIYLHSPAS